MKAFLRFGRSRQNIKIMMADEVVTSTAGASTSRRRPNRDFQVFLNFRGPDSRLTVIDVIVDALDRAGVRVFYDDESIRQGEVIGGELREAIINSKIYIPIFSKDYASSRCCLRELELIMECWEASQGQDEEKTILPIFYDVDVNLKSKLYANALKKHKKKLGENVVKPWEVALQKAATIGGLDTRKHGLTKLTKLVVEEVCGKLRRRNDLEKVPKSYVEIDKSMEDVMKLIDLDTLDVRFVAIHGINGTGKTTLARLIFHKISSNFQQGVAFLSDVREKSRTSSIVKLQKDLLSQLGQVKFSSLRDADDAVNSIKTVVKDKKVLVILDDLDSSEQLLKLAGDTSWFGIGSRIILTTRNTEILPQHDGFHQYKMQEMKFDDALKLFSRLVFDSDSPPKEYNEISKEVVRTTGGLPLIINVIAPLFKYKKSAWGGILKKLQNEIHVDEVEATVSGTHLTRNFEVFLNFQGPNSCSSVVNALYDFLVRVGVQVFYDDKSNRSRGEMIEGELMEAITNSKIYIPIFSKDYASSRWSLCELQKIMECWEASQEQEEKKMILPIFYNVDFRDVGLQTELYTTALQGHKDVLGEDVVMPWEMALQKVAKIKGWDVHNQGLPWLVKPVVEDICCKLWRKSDSEKVPNDYVGMDDAMEDIMKLLDLDAYDVRFVTIHGISGVGKTTLARLVYCKISSYFSEGAAFLSDVCGRCHTIGIMNLQKDLILQLLNVSLFDLSDTNQGVNIIKERLHRKRVLLVLDDLDNSDQLSKLAGHVSWFGKGSRIIITTKNNGIMPKGEDFYQYKMKEMKSNDALKLFSRRIFNSDLPPKEYHDILRKVVDTTRRLPLAISVIAPLFRNNNMDAWKGTLEKVVHKDARENLIMSYEQLDYSEREIFLDIACLFVGKEIEDVTYYWEALQLYPKIGIKILKNISFIEIVDGYQIQMHNLLKDLGRNLVDGESNIPERRSRLWSPEEALSVICLKKGTEEVLALKLGKLNADCHFNYKQFAGLTKLKFLELTGGNFENEDFKKVFSELRWLFWNNCPVEFKATNLCFKNLNILILSENLITDDWGGWHEIKAAENLKVLKCTYCHRLTKSPNFFTFPQLQKLVFKFCGMLKEIDWSIGMLEHLTCLEITSLFNVRSLPDSIGGLKALSMLKLKLENLIELPTSIGKLENLKYLYLWCPKVRELPKSMGNLKLLVELDISYTAITKLPEFVTTLESLKVSKLPSPQFNPLTKRAVEILEE